VAGVKRDGVHQPADGVVHAEVAVDLLDHAVGGLGAQHDARAALVHLQLVQSALELPALGVQRRQLAGGGAVWVQDRGQQPVARVAGGPAGVVDLVLDDAHGDAV